MGRDAWGGERPHRLPPLSAPENKNLFADMQNDLPENHCTLDQPGPAPLLDWPVWDPGAGQPHYFKGIPA